MMILGKSIAWSRLVALGVLLAAAGAGYAETTPQAKKKRAAPRAKPAAIGAQPAIELEPKAIDLLKAASSRLAAARSMSFTAVVTYESPSRLGHPLAYTTNPRSHYSGPTSCE